LPSSQEPRGHGRPHLHRETTESFYILEGAFSFRCGRNQFGAGPGSYVLVPPGTVHVMEALEDGGRFLTLMVPAGLEDMFIELSELPSDSLRNPEVRGAIAPKYDSVPAELAEHPTGA
jgi:quercetin dioxygenase-like cupin family protein